jgi:histone deacetylase 1/2
VRLFTFFTLINLQQIIYYFLSFEAEELPYNNYFEYFGPEYKLDVPSNNMANHNTPEYLQKMTSKIIDNLRSMPFAPSVQLQGKYQKMDRLAICQHLIPVVVTEVPRDLTMEDYLDGEDSDDEDWRITREYLPCQS